MGLIAAGYAVTTAGSARAALEAIAGEMPDVLVVDWLMPEMRGDELLELIRDDRETRGLRVMFLSNYPRDDPNVAGAVVAGEAIPWLTKSRTTPRDLAEQVSRSFELEATPPPKPSAA